VDFYVTFFPDANSVLYRIEVNKKKQVRATSSCQHGVAMSRRGNIVIFPAVVLCSPFPVWPC